MSSEVTAGQEPALPITHPVESPKPLRAKIIRIVRAIACTILLVIVLILMFIAIPPNLSIARLLGITTYISTCQVS